MRRRRVIACCAAALGLLPLGGAPLAAYPERPITAIVPFAAGGGTDGVARILAEQLGRELGQPVVIENRGGANATIGAAAAARARPDGHTVFFTTGTTQAMNPYVLKTLPYDPVRDFTPIARIGGFPMMLAAHPGLEARTPQELFALARREPGRLTFGHWSTIYHAAAEALARGAGIEILRVPYRGSSATMTDLMAGRISMAIVDLTVGMPLARGGQIRALAVTGASRSPLMPELPTLQEAGVAGYDIGAWMAVYAPARTPREATDRFGQAVLKVLRDPAMVRRLSELGFDVDPGDAEELAAFQQRELARWGEIIRAAGIQPE
jgi:tripartite-type tricarboxylate transporter receptor subunit TctC